MKTLYGSLLSVTLFALLSAGLAPDTLCAQTARINPARTSDLSNEDWTSWRVGVLTGEEADKAYASGNYADAAALYDKAILHFRTVQKSKPYWNRKGIADRIAAMGKKADSARRLAEKAGNTSAAQKPENADSLKLADAVSQLAALKLALEAAQKQNARQKAALERAEGTARQVRGLLAEKSETEKKYSLLLIQYNDLKNKPGENEADKALKAVLEEEKKRSEALQNERNALQQENAAQKLNAARMEREIQELEKNAAALRQKITAVDRLEKEILSLQQQIRTNASASQEQVRKNQAEIHRLNAELAKKSRQADEANEALIKTRAKMDLNEASRILEREAAALRAENAMLVKEAAAREAELKKAQESGEKTEFALEKTKALAANLTEQNRQRQEDLKKAEKVRNALAAENKKLVISLTAASQDVARLQKERGEFARALSQKTGEASTQMLAAKAKADERIRELEAANEKLESIRASLEQRNGESEKKIAELSESLKKSEASIRELEKQVGTLSGSAAELKKAVADGEQLKKTAAAQKAELDRLAAGNAELTRELASVREAREKLETESKDSAKIMRDTMAALETEKIMLAADNAALKRQLQLKSEKLAETEKTAASVPALRNELQKSRKQTADAEKAVEAGRQAHADQLKKQSEELRRQTAEKVRVLMEKLDALEKQLAQEKRKNTELIRTAAQTQQKKAEPETSRPVQQVPSASVQEERIRRLTEQLKAAQKALQTSETRAIEREKELAGLKNDLKNTEETMAKLAKSSQGVNQTDLAMLREANSRLNETIRTLNAERAKLSETNIKLQKDLQTKEAQLENMRADNAADIKSRKLQADLEAKTKELQQSEQERQAAGSKLELLTREKEQLQARNDELKKNLELASQKASALQSEVRKWSEGSDAVVKEKLAEKDKALDQVMKEYLSLTDEIARLRALLGNANAETTAARKALIESKKNEEILKKKLKELSPNAADPEADTVLYTTSVDVPKEQPSKPKAAAPERKPAHVPTAEQKKNYEDAMAEAKKFESEKDPDQALWKYLTAADADPGAWEPHLAIAKIYLQSEKKDSARKEYLKALKNGAPRDAALDKALSVGQ